MHKPAIKFIYLLVLLMIINLSCAPSAVDVMLRDVAAQDMAERMSATVHPLGHIKSEVDIRNGYGFAVKDYGIITCTHIAARDTMLFQPVMGKADIRIALKYKMEAFDLAVYDIVDGEDIDEYEIGDFAGVRPYDTVVYFGWEPAKFPKIKVIPSVVAATGQVARLNESLAFIDFMGPMKPGYSGGPVLDRNGKVIAIASECAIVKGFKGTREETIIRAFSLEPLPARGTDTGDGDEL